MDQILETNTKEIKINNKDFILPSNCIVLNSFAFQSLVIQEQSSSKKYILKKFEYFSLSRDELIRLTLNISLNKRNKSSFVLKTIRIIISNKFSTNPVLYIATPKYDTSLFRILHSQNKLTESHCSYILYQIIVHIFKLHDLEITLTGLSLADILINSDCSIALTKFLFTKSINLKKNYNIDPSLSDGIDQGRWYMAPEVFYDQCNVKSDMWTVGCILFEMLTKEVLCPGDNSIDCFNYTIKRVGGLSDCEIDKIDQENVKRAIRKCKLHQNQNINYLIQGLCEDARDFILKVIIFDFEKRMTPFEALAHPFLKNNFNRSDFRSRYVVDKTEIFDALNMSDDQLLEKLMQLIN